MNTEKRLEKIRKLTKDYREPLTDAFNYKSSLIHFFNYHNLQTSLSDMKKWAVEYLESFDLKPPNVRDSEFRTLGILVRLKGLDAYLEQNELDKIDMEVNRIMSLVVEEEENVQEVKTNRSESIENTINTKASEFIGEFEGLIDEFFTQGTFPNIQGLISTMGISNRVSPKIQEYAKKKNEYYTSVVSDKEAMEYYSFSKPTLKKVASIYEDLFNKLSQSKKVRKTRAKKEKPAGVLTQNLKYLIQDEELGIRSVSPLGIVGATEVYLFRTDSRKLQYFKSVDGSTLTVKGTTILNYDESKSFQKNIRKPEILKELMGKGKIDSRRFFKDINSVEQSVSGRTNEHTLILNVLK